MDNLTVENNHLDIIACGIGQYNKFYIYSLSQTSHENIAEVWQNIDLI